MKFLTWQIFFILPILYCSITSCWAEEKDVSFDEASSIVLLDEDTNIILYQKNPETLISPASLSKLMTIELTLKALEQGRIKASDQIQITEDIWRKGGAPSRGFTMFAKLNSKVPIKDLLYALIIDNANDAALALAQAIAGSYVDFVTMMNNEASNLGLSKTHYASPTGNSTNGEDHTTLIDSIKLMRYIVKKYPNYSQICALPQYSWNNIKQNNKNYLLNIPASENPLPDFQSLAGIIAHNNSGNIYIGHFKRGHNYGYIAIAGCSSTNSGKKLIHRILKWQSNEFTSVLLFPMNDSVVQIPVYGGVLKKVDAVPTENIYSLISKNNQDFTQAYLRYKTPLIAPIKAGDNIAQIDVCCQNQLMISKELVAKQTVSSAGLIHKFYDALYEITIGFWYNKLVNKFIK